MFEGQPITKRPHEERTKTTNCFDCGIKLNMNEFKTNPENDGDKRIFCLTHYKKRFGKKKKLIKRV